MNLKGGAKPIPSSSQTYTTERNGSCKLGTNISALKIILLLKAAILVVVRQRGKRHKVNLISYVQKLSIFALTELVIKPLRPEQNSWCFQKHVLQSKCMYLIIRSCSRSLLISSSPVNVTGWLCFTQMLHRDMEIYCSACQCLNIGSHPHFYFAMRINRQA